MDRAAHCARHLRREPAAPGQLAERRSRHAVRRDGALVPAAQHPLCGGRGRYQPFPGAPHHPAHAHRHPLQQPLRQAPDRELPGAHAAVGGGHDGRLRGAGPGALLRLFRGEPDPHVFPHRRVGRPESGVRRAQVLPLHLCRLGADGGRHPPGLLLDRHVRHRRPAERTDSGPGADVGLRGLCAGLCGEDAALPLPHLAARRARAGPHGWLHHPGRRPPEDGHLRLPAAGHPALSPGVGAVGVARRAAGGDRHSLRRPGGAQCRRTSSRSSPILRWRTWDT